MKISSHRIPIQTLYFKTCLPTRQNGVGNRDKVYCEHRTALYRIFRAVEKEESFVFNFIRSARMAESLFSLGIWSYLPDSIINLSLPLRSFPFRVFKTTARTMYNQCYATLNQSRS